MDEQRARSAHTALGRRARPRQRLAVDPVAVGVTRVAGALRSGLVGVIGARRRLRGILTGRGHEREHDDQEEDESGYPTHWGPIGTTGQVQTSGAVVGRHPRRLTTPSRARLRRDRPDHHHGSAARCTAAQRRRAARPSAAHGHRRGSAGRLPPTLALRQGLPPPVRDDPRSLPRQRVGPRVLTKPRCRSQRASHQASWLAPRMEGRSRTSPAQAPFGDAGLMKSCAPDVVGWPVRRPGRSVPQLVACAGCARRLLARDLRVAGAARPYWS